MTIPSKTSTPYARIDVIAKFFDVSQSTIRGWVKDGTIPSTAYIKSGRTYRFRLTEVEHALLASPEKVAVEENENQLSLDFGNDVA